MRSFKILAGDCRERLRDLPDASVDSCVTDPPYDLVSIVKRFGKAGSAPAQHGTDGAFARASRGFMGQTWDGTGVAFDPATWAEVLRVLKPGGHLLAFGGSRTYHRMACAIEDAGLELRDQIMWIYGSGFPKSHNLQGDHEGWGTALKPAHEPIAMARKPIVGSVAANVAAHGTGAININGCRIGEGGGTKAGVRRIREDGISDRYEVVPSGHARNTIEKINKGRWPANVIHDGSDEVVASFQEASRFFYCAKASKSDREAGCATLPSALIPNAGRDSGRSFVNGEWVETGTVPTPRHNHHPTVKPTDLMRYLVRMVTPAGGTVLDPFTGSGSTGRAAVLEGFDFIGCEMTAEYVPIAEARIADACSECIKLVEQGDMFTDMQCT